MSDSEAGFDPWDEIERLREQLIKAKPLIEGLLGFAAEEDELFISEIAELRALVKQAKEWLLLTDESSAIGLDWKLSGKECPHCRGAGRIGVIACNRCGATGRTTLSDDQRE